MTVHELNVPGLTYPMGIFWSLFRVMFMHKSQSRLMFKLLTLIKMTRPICIWGKEIRCKG